MTESMYKETSDLKLTVDFIACCNSILFKLHDNLPILTLCPN